MPTSFTLNINDTESEEHPECVCELAVDGDDSDIIHFNPCNRHGHRADQFIRTARTLLNLLEEEAPFLTPGIRALVKELIGSRV